MEAWQHSGKGVWAVSLLSLEVCSLETLPTYTNHHVGKLPLAFSARKVHVSHGMLLDMMMCCNIAPPSPITLCLQFF